VWEAAAAQFASKNHPKYHFILGTNRDVFPKLPSLTTDLIILYEMKVEL
jgi:uncharacterized protein with NRDE domain